MVLTELHEEHMGVSCMKALACCHIWWKGLGKESEELWEVLPYLFGHEAITRKSSVTSMDMA